jgi:iron complex transport system substrate-binding protein
MLFVTAAPFRRVLFLLCAVFFSSGCNATPPDANVESPVAPRISSPRVLARDDLGREIRLAQTPQRVVVIGPGATEILFALGAGKRLIGRDQISTYPKEAQRAPVMGDFSGPFLEATTAAHPDFVIVQGETYDRARADAWQKQIGAPVAVLAATTLSGVADGIRKIASWLEVEGAAQPLLKRFEAVKNTREYAHEKNRPSAFFEVGRAPLWASGNNTLIGDVMRAAGVRNATSDISGYKAYSLETLQTRRIDWYISTAQKTDEAARQNVLVHLRAQPGIRDLECVKKGRVVVLNADEVLRPGPRLLNGIETLRRAVNAEK